AFSRVLPENESAPREIALELRPKHSCRFLRSQDSTPASTIPPPPHVRFQRRMQFFAIGLARWHRQYTADLRHSVPPPQRACLGGRPVWQLQPTVIRTPPPHRACLGGRPVW